MGETLSYQTLFPLNFPIQSLRLQDTHSFTLQGQFSHSVVSDSVTPWTAARQAPLSFTNSWTLLKLMSLESVMPSNHLTLCHPLLLLPSIFKTLQSLNLKFRGHQDHLEVLSDETAGSHLFAVAGSAVVLRLLVEGRPPGVPFLYRISHSLAGRRHLFPLQ